MPMSPANQRTFHRHLFAGWNIPKITLLKRGIDQQQGTVTSYELFECRRGQINKTGEPIQDDMSSRHTCIWHLPRIELDRIGIKDINAADRIVEVEVITPFETHIWQPESTTSIDTKLGNVHVDVSCLRVDPPRVPNT
jgi:hypothetical protein